MEGACRRCGQMAGILPGSALGSVTLQTVETHCTLLVIERQLQEMLRMYTEYWSVSSMLMPCSWLLQLEFGRYLPYFGMDLDTPVNFNMLPKSRGLAFAARCFVFDITRQVARCGGNRADDRAVQDGLGRGTPSVC
jgi:hypothetical protein